jgi:transcriptional regulator with XRE-family HTH domain
MQRMTGRELLAANLKRQRGLRDFSQEELADLASIDRTYISSLERCLYAASVDIIDRLASALGVEPAELLRRPPAGP